MTGTEELLLGVVPVVGASEMSTLRRECDHLAVIELHGPGGALLTEDAPAIDAIAAEDHLDRRVWNHLGDVARLGQFVLLAKLGREEEIDGSGNGESSADGRP